MATDLSGHVCTCEDCGTRYEYDWRKGLNKRRCRDCSRRRWIQRRMQAPLECTCQECGRRYIYDPRKGHTKRRCNSCRSSGGGAAGRAALKARMVAHKGGRCQRCGYDRCLRALHFHHLEPERKRFNLHSAFNRSWTSVLAELDDCLLTCSNCHRELEGAIRRAWGPRGGRPAREPAPDATMYVCERCGRQFEYRPRRARRYCMSCSTSRADPEQRAALKRWMLDLTGGRCRLCGYDKHPEALEFHHIDPALKRFNVAGSHGRSLEALRLELEKCILLCANCHDEVDAGAAAIPAEIAAEVHSRTAHLPRYERRPPGRPVRS